MICKIILKCFPLYRFFISSLKQVVHFAPPTCSLSGSVPQNHLCVPFCANYLNLVGHSRLDSEEQRRGLVVLCLPAMATAVLLFVMYHGVEWLCRFFLISPLSSISIKKVGTFLPSTRVSPYSVNAERMCWEGQGQGSISEALLRLFPRRCNAPESAYANCGN